MSSYNVKTAAIEQATQALEGYRISSELNWWNKHRLSLVRYVLNKRAYSHDDSLLDFGCGKGMQLAELQKYYPLIDCVGYEPFLNSELQTPVFKDLCSLKDRKFTAITALDVIEHIEDDLNTLKQMHHMLDTNGMLIVTVPAFMHLYCPIVDTAIGHYRRYKKQEIKTIVESAGFKVWEVFYVFPYLYPVCVMRKCANRVLRMLGISVDETTITHRLPIDPLKMPSMLSFLEVELIKKTR